MEKKARIVPIFKCGDEEKAENYRGISLRNIGYKILTTIIANRSMAWADREKKNKGKPSGIQKGERHQRSHNTAKLANK